VSAVVLDEADRMLDLGFREDLERILAHAPAGHRTHLVSATFPRDVKALADRVQQDPAHVQGTPLGAANEDIDHVLHLVDPRQRADAVVNLLLAHPDEQTLVFARTRADVAELAAELSRAGFAVGSLSGEMEQPERTRAMGAFKRGHLRALVATDVAARGIDVQDIARVIHADPPSDADTYTHRSGRTGRAGKSGTSSVLVPPAALSKISSLLKRARVAFRVEPVPSAETIRKASEERAYAELVREEAEGFAGYEARIWALAQRLSKSEDVARVIARLLAKTGGPGRIEPREIRVAPPPTEVKRRGHPEPRQRDDHERGEGAAHAPKAPSGERKDRHPGGGEWVPFRVSWGAEQGADPRRLLALVCRRGGIRGAQVGAIRLARRHAIVEIARGAAGEFAQAVKEPDPRDRNVTIREEHAAPTVARHPAARRGEGRPFAPGRRPKAPHPRRA
jgi:ATP-dependent RNA helicase DeaD